MRPRLPLLATIALALLIVALVAILVPRLRHRTSPVEAPDADRWPTCAPEEQGLDSAELARGLLDLAERGVPFHSLVVIRNGCVLLDASRYPYSSQVLHNMASVTKSVMTTLISIAADQGKLDLDAPMLDYFPGRPVANMDARKQAMTVRHLTGMVNGFQSGCFAGDEPTLNTMRSQSDWIQAALDRPMVRDPGTRFCYDSPGMHLLSAILQQATGMTAFEFAREFLFTPLGIQDVAWQTDPQGYSHGWGDLALTPSDAAKIGYLWLSNGVWKGRQIVPAAWVHDAATVQVQASPDDYGFGWWVSGDSFYAMGRGGQTIKAMPSLDAVVVTTGAGLEYDEVAAMLAKAFVGEGAPLPPNPDGVASLRAIEADLGQGPAPQPVAPLPALAKIVSGKTYVFDRNDADIDRLGLEFNETAVATLHLASTGQPAEAVWAVGLDGAYRFQDGMLAARGSWIDEHAFNLEVVDFTDSQFAPRNYQLRFEEDRLAVVCTEIGLKIEGRQLPP